MKPVFIVNEADNFHSLNSFRLVGVASTKQKAIKLIKDVLKTSIDNHSLTAYDEKQLNEINQTQQDKFDWEYNIKEVELNKVV